VIYVKIIDTMKNNGTNNIYEPTVAKGTNSTYCKARKATNSTYGKVGVLN
jgi:hypothetical protein